MTGEATALPAPDAFSSVFATYEVRHRDDGGAVYFGDPLVDQRRLLQSVYPVFRDAGYEVRLDQRTGEYVLVAEPREEEAENSFPWTNLVLAVVTVFSTLYAGASWYYVTDPFSAQILRAVPFTLAVMGVLGTHEFGHYLASKYHDVDATLPYFIPVPTLIGTMGAVIKMNGHIPDREALFDIGVAGPLAGLAATVVVSAAGLLMGPITVPPAILNAAPGQTVEIQFHYPLLLHGIAWALGKPLGYPNDPSKTVNPVVIGAWVGMFVTVLNLIPVGQLDGGHVLRSILGEAHRRVAGLVPLALVALAGYVYFFTTAGQAAFIWVLWAGIAGFMAWRGSAVPIDERPLGRTRVAVGVLTFVLGLLCFVPVPIQIVT